ncbi:MAG: hypothetical protein ACKOWW_03935 [Flavobacteriales bacterium]
MRNNWLFSILLLIVLGSCINGEQTYRVDYTNILCGGNSKVWELDVTKATENGAQRTYQRGEGLFIFYGGGKVEIGSLKDLSEHTTDKGSYTFNQTTQILTIRIAKEYWKFNLSMDRDGNLWLKTLTGHGLNKYMHLVPLRAPQSN